MPQGPAVQFATLGQFIRDFSFESPAAPESLAGGQGTPEMEVNVDVQSRRRPDGLYECDLKIRGTARRGDATVFIVELVYCGLYQIANIPEEHLAPVLLIECPRLIFPFARRIIADATSDGGFPPLHLEPIDFAALYRNRMARQAAANQEANA